MRRRTDRRSRRRGAARPRAAADAALLLGLRPSRLRPRPRAEQRHRRVRPRGGHDRRQRLRRHGDHRRRLARLDRPRRGGRAAVDHGALPAQGRQLSRHLAALPERRHRQDDPLQPQGRRQRPRRDLLPARGPALRPAVFRRRGRGRGAGCAPPSAGSGRRPSGAGTPRAAATSSTGTGARTTAGA